MTLGGKKKARQAQEAARELERRLDTAHASKVERELARSTFRSLAAPADHPPWNTIMRRAMGSVVRARKVRDTAPTDAV